MQPQNTTENQDNPNSNEPERTVKPSIYPEATEGRLQTSSAPQPDEQKIISANIDGSPEYEAFKQNVREAKSVQMEDNLFGRIVFFVIGIVMLAFSERLYGWRIPIISYILKGVAAIFIIFLIYYTVRQIQISLASRRYKKNRKKNS
ncbi:hypothetical protein IKE86_02690 [Candidatus Saccharibacteria bacterium]|nr:hypothetical protein [Candidatus Saccharibacteria bacterium]